MRRSAKANLGWCTAARKEFISVMLGASLAAVTTQVGPAVPLSDGTPASSPPDVPSALTRPKPVQSYSSNAAGWLYYPGRPRKGDILEAIREPENPHDSNAIALWLHGKQAGHVARFEAAQIAPQMDRGLRAEVVCTRARGNSKSGALIDIHLFEPERPADPDLGS